MALSQEVTAFVQAAVRLPEERLRRVDRAWDQLQPHSAVVAELVRFNLGFLAQATELREYVMAEARRSAAERENEQLIPEDVAEAVLPTARVGTREIAPGVYLDFDEQGRFLALELLDASWHCDREELVELPRP
jgi:hypothetical protein